MNLNPENRKELVAFIGSLGALAVAMGVDLEFLTNPDKIDDMAGAIIMAFGVAKTVWGVPNE